MGRKALDEPRVRKPANFYIYRSSGGLSKMKFKTFIKRIFQNNLEDSFICHNLVFLTVRGKKRTYKETAYE
jgi:hypothetical protein